MDEENKKFWDTTKQEPLVEHILKYKTSGVALDLGAGEGRDILFLAQKGFKVVAVENDEKSLHALQQKIGNSGSAIDVVNESILSYEPQQDFDVIICDMVLHFLEPTEVVTMINRMQAWTKNGGLNVVMVYTDKNPPGKRPYLFKTDELRDFYQGWEVLVYEEKPTLWFQLPSEPEPRRNHAAYLIARKT